MARFLDVFLGEGLVGRLEQDDHGALWFQYDSAWLGRGDAVPLSASLPLRPEKYKRNECRPFFAGLLPEETSRKLVAQAFGVSERNDFAILEKIGAECAGAVSLMPPGERPVIGQPSYRAISEAHLAEKLAAVPSHPLMAGEDGIRLSLAGAQGKIAAMIRDGEYFLPLDGSPSTHILKPDSPHFPGLVENEHFCMRLAAEAGLDVAKTEIDEFNGQKFLLVERYDRRLGAAGVLERIHQEDFCQALGIPPEMKYQEEGGPGLKQCFELVRAQSAAPGPDVLKLFDAVVFNWLIGNSDAHGKNFSFLYREGGCRLAPLYDLICTRAYPGISTGMAMKIGGEREPNLIFSKNWIGLIADIGIGHAAALRRMQQLAKRVESSLDKIPSDSSVIGIIRGNAGSLVTVE